MNVTINLNNPVDVANAISLLTGFHYDSLRDAAPPPATQAAPPPATQAAPPPATQEVLPPAAYAWATQAEPLPAAPPEAPADEGAKAGELLAPAGYDQAAHAERVLAAARDLGASAKLLGPHMQALGLSAVTGGTPAQLGQLEVIIGQISAGA